jgi:hypothetical protein
VTARAAKLASAPTAGIALGLALAISTRSAVADERVPADRQLNAALLWGAMQLLPSPLLVTGGHGVAGGVRWQLTPLLYSFGITERPVRAFIAAPVARHSGAFELYVSPEWACCASGGDSSWLGRVGARVYVPAIGRGESLAVSVGGSYYYENHRHGGAAELGVYGLSSLIGLSVTVAPRLIDREVILALTLHLF